MVLMFSRFKKCPEFLKFYSLILTFIVIILLWTTKFHPPGISIIWFTIIVSIIFDFLTIFILLKQFDISKTFLQMLPYAAIECSGSLLIIVLFILSSALSISSEEVTDDSSFILLAILCILISIGNLLNAIIYIRKWINNTHLAPSSDYENYGAYEN